MIRDDADKGWLACQLQHERMMTPAPDPSNPAPRADLVRQAIDLDFFFVAVNRLAAVAGLAADVSDPRKVLPEAIARFTEDTAGWPLSDAERHQHATVTGIRNALEHTANLAKRGGLGLARGHLGWWVTYKNSMFETQELLAAADELHKAIRSAIDTEAFSDFHGDYPLVELRDPSQITCPPRPGSEILTRQTDAMAMLQTSLSRPTDGLSTVRD
jgi:hypothetical protein